jgi:hypothetical protein
MKEPAVLWAGTSFFQKEIANGLFDIRTGSLIFLFFENHSYES